MWNNPRARAIIYQVLVLGGVIGAAAYLIDNTLTNLAERSIRSGFSFIWHEAGFAISEALIDYQPNHSYVRAFIAGLLNTLKVGLLGIVLVTILGIIIGIARLSTNWLVARLASVYVETFRNVPLLLQLYLWYSLLTEMLPGGRDALSLFTAFYLNKSGLMYPVPVYDGIHPFMIVAFLIGCVGAYAWGRYATRRHEATGVPTPRFWPSVGFVLGLPLVVWLIGGAPTAIDVPQMERFRFVGGWHVSIEFIALLLGLVVYTGAFVAETVRAGILSVSRGQTEAALSLGLRRGLVLRLVLLPQALRVIMPPLTSQYLNLMKNSSLAVAIGYPDLVAVANTTLNQTGQAIEAIAVIMAVYLTISLAISGFMNWYNKRVALVER
ncbi:MAG: ABC transporter permease subunit [Rhodospirillales bacterium]|nr:ABC transporter permease subunit [Rhodospirillales bacterium]